MEESTKDKILIAAKELFIEKGFGGTTMRDISTHANINKGLLHYYFQNKNKLFESVLQMATFQFIPKVDNIVHLDINFESKMELIVDEYIEFLINNPQLPPFVLNEMNLNRIYL
ncbi:MAG: TetR/AcrR family transcriptional regulator [Saprospiraceae bacterium]